MWPSSPAKTPIAALGCEDNSSMSKLAPPRRSANVIPSSAATLPFATSTTLQGALLSLSEVLPSESEARPGRRRRRVAARPSGLVSSAGPLSHSESELSSTTDCFGFAAPQVPPPTITALIEVQIASCDSSGSSSALQLPCA
eukprot:CAMPEP_0175182000 /NCGR_PEP_ID=MMETSP0093-20121207/83_1 /TAXON_ID=311494 /ORGANISM="Alexandrium monilatum, Strain CCMP3105" /LENGTH=141 /DNA_ID=CAMNT_0016474543 /DNA_START=1284 /DNA_END=1706 /DNA_ORIENTATION=+